MSIKKAKEVIRIEAEAISALANRLDDQFIKAIDILLHCQGRVIVTGMGKSGIIANKIASMFTSTGTASLFVHPAEVLHGDLGAVLSNDVVICLSKSGQTEEVLRILPLFKRKGVCIITLTGNPNSDLANRSDVVLNVSVKEEACPYDLVPTSSTTAALVMGDALAISLFQERGLSAEDFAALHPGGDIGRRLYLKVDDIMRTGKDIAIVHPETPLNQAILEITGKRLGATCVVDEKGELLGIITDGDLRRLIREGADYRQMSAKDVMTQNPKTVDEGVLAAHALHEMEKYSINQLIIVNVENKPVGMVHIHDLLKAELA